MLVDHEKHAVPLDEAREIDARLVQQLAARALHEGEVLGMVHHAARVGVLVVHADGNFQLSDKRSGEAAAPCGATIPKWRYADSVAMRPRGVRCR